MNYSTEVEWLIGFGSTAEKCLVMASALIAKQQRGDL